MREGDASRLALSRMPRHPLHPRSAITAWSAVGSTDLPSRPVGPPPGSLPHSLACLRPAPSAVAHGDARLSSYSLFCALSLAVSARLLHTPSWRLLRGSHIASAPPADAAQAHQQPLPARRASRARGVAHVPPPPRVHPLVASPSLAWGSAWRRYSLALSLSLRLSLSLSRSLALSLCSRRDRRSPRGSHASPAARTLRRSSPAACRQPWRPRSPPRRPRRGPR